MRKWVRQRGGFSPNGRSVLTDPNLNHRRQARPPGMRVNPPLQTLATSNPLGSGEPDGTLALAFREALKAQSKGHLDLTDSG
jgi:hypothetical protein